MLLLVTILLVVVGTISLVIGFVQSALLPIYISIACSVLAAVVLLIFSRMTAKSQQVVTSGGPSPLPDREPERAGRTEPVPAFAGTGLADRSSSDSDFGPPEDRYGSGSRYDDVDDDDLVETPQPPPEDDDLPIERYDSRRVGEILPLLAELDLDELDIVREHEEQGKARATVLARIDQLIDQLEAEDREEAASRFDPEPPRTSSFAPAAVDEPAEDEELELVDQGDESDLAHEEPPAAATPPPPPSQPVTVGALPEDDDFFPIEDYDDLRASEILPLLPELDDDELVMVRDRERNTAARSSILRRIDALLEDSQPAAAAPAPEPEPEPAPPAPAVVADESFTTKVVAKRAPAAKKTTKAAPVKKAGAKKAAALPSVPVPPKKAPAKKAPAATKAVLEKSGTINKVGTRKASVAGGGAAAKKAPAKAPAAKAPAAKAPAAKAPAAKAPAAKKTPAAASKATAAKSSTKVAKATRKATKG